MVPVKKPIIAAKAPEASAPQKRRPRNQELNSSKKFIGAAELARYRKLNCSRQAVINQLVDEAPYSPEDAEELVTSFEEETGANVERLATIEEAEQYDGMFWATKDGKTSLWCRGNGFWYEKDDLNSSEEPDSVNPSEKDAGSLNSEAGSSAVDRELGVLWQHWDVEDDGSVYTHAWIGPDDDSEECFYVSTRDAQVANAISDAIDKSIETTGKEFGWENDPQYADLQVNYSTTFGDSGKTTVGELRNVLESAIQKASGDLDSACGGKLNSSEDSGDANPSEKGAQLNSSEGDIATVYTDSGNEVAITDIKVVQNPETNALALFVPENGDDEIPEGFTVIGDVIATATGAPAIEENAETGDDSLNSSKKPPMNRAQRRAAQRGARRPKKR